MKKFILMAVLTAVMTVPVAAQEEYAPQAGSFSTEIQFNPFSNDYTTFKQGDMGLSVRYFITNKDAVRLNLGFGTKKDINNVDQVSSWNNTTGEITGYTTLHNSVRHSNFNLNLGYERHLLTKGRVDLYAGAQIGVGLESYGRNWETLKNKVNAAGDPVYSYGHPVYDGTVKHWANTGNGKIGSTNFNFGVFTGIDFYVYKGLYVGAELGINLQYKADHQYCEKADGEELKKDDHKQPTGKSFNFGTHVNPALRLGWTF